jgi:ATP-dependent DNA helicase DinG
MKIRHIKKIDYKGDVYNLHIKDNHNYFANNHCVSNCHDFDDVMSDFISIKITEAIIKRLKFTNEYQILKDFNKVKNIDQYIKFLKELNTEITETIDSISNTMSSGGRSAVSDKRDLKINKLTGGSNQDIKLMQIITDLKQYQLKIEVFLKEFEINPENWVLETSVNEKTKSKELSLEPIWAYDYLDKYVWSHYDMIVLMSGTILNKQIFSELNGISSDSSVYYSMPSPFPIKHRPIYYLPVGKMSYAKKEETFKRYVPLISRIVKKYTGKKGIIHTNSFELAEWIKNDIEEPRLVFHGSDDKMEVLQSHFDSEKDTVIVSPSLHTGVSFDNDKARFQIIAKIPYPSLASQKNKLRQKTNPEWYAWKTCVNLQQSFGRINRNKNDFGDTIVIDESFSDVLKYSSHFIPQWIQESIKKIELK